MDALSAVMENLKKPKKEEVRVEAPALLSLGSLTLFFVAIDLALVVYLSDAVFPPAFAGAVSKALTAIFGVAVVTYTDEIRQQLFRRCQTWRFRFLVLVPLLAWLPTTIPYDVTIVSPRSAKLMLDSATADRTPSNDSIFTVSVRGFRPRSLFVYLAHTDTFELQRSDMMLAAAHQYVPGLGWIIDRNVHANPSGSVFLLTGRKRGELKVIPRIPRSFPLLYIQSMRRQGFSFVKDNGVMTAALTPTDESTELRMPPGIYDFTFKVGRCLEEHRGVDVRPDTSKDVRMIDPCR